MKTKTPQIMNKLLKIIFVIICYKSSIYSQITDSISSYIFLENNGVEFADINRHLPVITDTNCGCYDIILYSYGRSSDVIHYHIIDSTITVYVYKLMDSLTFISKKIFALKNEIDLNHVSGFYQVYSQPPISNTYAKDISIYKNAELVFRVLLEDVKRLNKEIPDFKTLKPLLQVIKITQT
jgi:hypothetical protein